MSAFNVAASDSVITVAQSGGIYSAFNLGASDSVLIVEYSGGVPVVVVACSVFASTGNTRHTQNTPHTYRNDKYMITGIQSHFTDVWSPALGVGSAADGSVSFTGDGEAFAVGSAAACACRSTYGSVLLPPSGGMSVPPPMAMAADSASMHTRTTCMATDAVCLIQALYIRPNKAQRVTRRAQTSGRVQFPGRHTETDTPYMLDYILTFLEHYVASYCDFDIT